MNQFSPVYTFQISVSNNRIINNVLPRIRVLHLFWTFLHCDVPSAEVPDELYFPAVLRPTALLKVFDILALFSVLHMRDFCAFQMHQEEWNSSIYPAVCPDLDTGREETDTGEGDLYWYKGQMLLRPQSTVYDSL